MKARLRKNMFQALFLLTMLLFLGVFFQYSTKDVNAATKGFVTKNGKTYYIDSDGSYHKGWLTLNGLKYYFGSKSGVQLKGWQINSAGKKIRYFTQTDGHMCTGYLTDSKKNVRYFDKSTGLLTRGWMTDSKGYKYYFTSGSGVMAKGWMTNSKGEKRYFNTTNGRMRTSWIKNSKNEYRYFYPSTGIMYTGLKKIGGYYYYFSKTTGIRYQKGFGTTGGNKYYFNTSTGKAQTGWLTLNNNRYYFSLKGVMYVSTTANISGQTYTFDANGVATASKYVMQGSNVKVYDEKNGRNYLLMGEYLKHPGVASGAVSDLDLLAALCESEAGDQGEIGMEAVALCILNRTIKSDKEFPSQVRYVIYQGVSFPQYSVVTNGALLKRINGQYENRTLAYSAAKKAMTIFENYVTKGTARKLTGFKKDFNYMYFMMESSFWAQPLTFSKVEYFLYKDHMFFVDWV